MAIPIFQQQDLLGVLVADPKRVDDPYEEGEMRWADAMAAQAALALGNARSVEDLRALQSLQQSIFEALTAGVILMDEAGRILQANPFALEFLCLSAEHLPARRMPELPVEKRFGLRSYLDSSIRSLEAVENQEIQISIPRSADLIVSIRPIDVRHDKKVYLVIFHDISEHKKMEALARKQESLARVGEMIASINHEIKNLVQPIQYQVNLFTEEAFELPEHRRFYGIIKARLIAIQRLVASLRDLSRPMELRKQSLNLSNLVASVWREFEQQPQYERIQFSASIPDEAQTVPGDGQLLMQVLYNLIKNSVEAMNGIPAPKIHVQTSLNGDQVFLVVEDNGPGIGDHCFPRLFEPFNSTKRGSGTGLGLSISKKIVEAHGGALTASNQSCGGACFQIALPVRANEELQGVHIAS